MKERNKERGREGTTSSQVEIMYLKKSKECVYISLPRTISLKCAPGGTERKRYLCVCIWVCFFICVCESVWMAAEWPIRKAALAFGGQCFSMGAIFANGIVRLFITLCLFSSNAATPYVFVRLLQLLV